MASGKCGLPVLSDIIEVLSYGLLLLAGNITGKQQSLLEPRRASTLES